MGRSWLASALLMGVVLFEWSSCAGPQASQKPGGTPASLDRYYLRQNPKAEPVELTDPQQLRLAAELHNILPRYGETLFPCIKQGKTQVEEPILEEDRDLIYNRCRCLADRQVPQIAATEKTLLAAYPQLLHHVITRRRQVLGQEDEIYHYELSAEPEPCAEAKALAAKLPTLKAKALQAKAELLRRYGGALELASQFFTLQRTGDCAKAYGLTHANYRKYISAEEFAADCRKGDNTFDKIVLLTAESTTDRVNLTFEVSRNDQTTQLSLQMVPVGVQPAGTPPESLPLQIVGVIKVQIGG